MKLITIVSILFCARLLSAQIAGPTPVGSDSAAMAFREMEIFARSVQTANQEVARHVAEKRVEELERKQFRDKAARFVMLWDDFVTRINEKQTFDVKLAKQLSKAFHELEKSDGWPVQPATSSVELAKAK